jgi:membrane protein DedA with SNARE-associated domain
MADGGWRLMRRYGHVFHIEPWMLKVGVYLFRRYGARIVYFGRFIPLLRTWGAMLTGVNRYPWCRFLLWNSLGAITWAVLWGTLSYIFGRSLQSAEGTATMAALVIAIVISIVAGIVTIRKAEALRAAAEREFPGSLDELAAR